MSVYLTLSTRTRNVHCSYESKNYVKFMGFSNFHSHLTGTYSHTFFFRLTDYQHLYMVRGEGNAGEGYDM